MYEVTIVDTPFSSLSFTTITDDQSKERTHLKRHTGNLLIFIQDRNLHNNTSNHRHHRSKYQLFIFVSQLACCMLMTKKNLPPHLECQTWRELPRQHQGTNRLRQDNVRKQQLLFYQASASGPSSGPGLGSRPRKPIQKQTANPLALDRW